MLNHRLTAEEPRAIVVNLSSSARATISAITCIATNYVNCFSTISIFPTLATVPTISADRFTLEGVGVTARPTIPAKAGCISQAPITTGPSIASITSLEFVPLRLPAPDGNIRRNGCSCSDRQDCQEHQQGQNGNGNLHVYDKVLLWNVDDWFWEAQGCRRLKDELESCWRWSCQSFLY